MTETQAVTLPVITTRNPLPAAQAGKRYRQTLSVTGGTEPYTWAAGLPAWLKLNPNTGVLYGRPAEKDVGPFYCVSVTVMDAAGQSSTSMLSLNLWSTRTKALTGDTALAEFCAAGSSFGIALMFVFGLVLILFS